MSDRPGGQPKQPIFFKVHGTQLLEAGNTQTLLAKAPCLWAHVKVYAEEGENGIHAHPDEDHLFFVVAGGAMFLGPGGHETLVSPLEGILIPRGTHYAFRSSGSENLVMLRVGAPRDSAQAESDAEGCPLGIPSPAANRIHLDGTEAVGNDSSNKTGAIPGVPAPGRVLGVPTYVTH